MKKGDRLKNGATPVAARRRPGEASARGDEPGASPSPPRPRRVRRGAYLLPSLFTIGNILLGFYAIVLGLRAIGLLATAGSGPRRARDSTSAAALLVFVAGHPRRPRRPDRPHDRHRERLRQGVRLARRRHHLRRRARPADLSLGPLRVGPARRLAAVRFFYLVCTATRLARFNVQTQGGRRPLLRGPAGAGRGGHDLLASSSSPPTPGSGSSGCRCWCSSPCC